MSDKLTEALAWVRSGPTVVGAKHIIALAEVAQRWQAFPTDEDVRRVVESIGRIDPRGVRLALETVKEDQEDFDRNVGLGGERMDYGPQLKRED